MVVLAIGAILLVLAAPSLRQLSLANTISSGESVFMSDMRYARSDAVRRGGGVVMCRSDAPENALPTCATSTVAGGRGWASGWIVFHDLDHSGQYASSDELLRVQGPISAIDSIAAQTSGIFSFTATGRLRTSNEAASLQFGGAAFSSTVQRVVCVDPSGRTRSAGDGSSSCN